MPVAVIVGTGAVLRGCFIRPATDFPGSHFNQGANAVWLGVEWVNEPQEPDAIIALANNLKQRQIHYVFAYASYLRSDGQFNPTYSHAARFNELLRENYPALNVQAWVGLPLDYLDLSDAGLREKIAEFCDTLVRNGSFDGIHLNPEPIPTDDPDVLALLDAVRGALDGGATLSIATRQIWPLLSTVRWPIIGERTWRAAYYREVGKRVDQIAVLATYHFEP